VGDGGGYPGRLFIEGARKTGIAACVPVQKIPVVLNLDRLKICDEERARQSGSTLLYQLMALSGRS
jgi:hypothetical protein